MILNIWVKYMNNKKIKINVVTLIFIILISVFTYFDFYEEDKNDNIVVNTNASYEMANMPDYSGNIYIEINNNIPEFSSEDINIEKDYYSNLENGRVRNGYDKNQLEKG